MSVRSQGTTLFTAILILVGTTVVVQLWLLTVSMEALLSGQIKTLVPAAGRLIGVAADQCLPASLCISIRPRR